MKKLLLAFCVCVASVSVFAQNKKSAEIIKKEALKQETVLDSIDYLKRNLDFADTAADTRSLLYYTGTLQEQLGLYTDAGNSYAKAAGIAAHDASNMPKVTSEQLVLNAVRANLCAGNWETADSYLNSAVRNSKNETVSATVKLYSVWSELCKASSVPGADISDSVELLKAYSSMQSMKSVKAQVLFTLWHLTSARVYAEELNREFPLSPEASVANGKRMGSAFKMTPKASIEDGKLDVMFTNKCFLGIHLIDMVIKFLKGNHVKDGKGFSYLNATDVRIIDQKAEMPIHLDGEVFSKSAKTAHIKILPGAITLLR